MDPLSVSASIIGVLGAAAKVSSVLTTFVQGVRGAPKLAQNVLSDVNGVSAVLIQLQLFLLGKSTPSKSGASLVLVEQVIVALQDSVKVFSELEDALGTSARDGDMSLLDRVKWTMKESRIADIQGRLQRSRSTLFEMLTVLQCKSLDEAESAISRLTGLVEQVLESNQEMSARLRDMDERATVALPAPETTAKDDASTTSSMTATPPPETAAQSEVHRNQFGFAFEEDLLASRVYRKPLYSRSGASLVSSAARTTSSSVLSGLSLTEVSNISILAVPIYAHEIKNSERYTFGDFSLPPLEEVPSQESTNLPAIGTPKARKRDRLTAAVWRQRKEKPPTPERQSLPVRTKSANPVFGIALADSVKLANVAISLTNEAGENFVYGYVPVVVAKVGVFLKEKATDVENIFSISGSVARLRTLQAAFNEPPRYGKGLDWSGFTVHDAAAILLRYLYQLPEPVIPLDNYEAFQQPLKEYEGKPIPSENFHTQYIIRQYQKLIRELPPLSRQLLLYLLDFLAVFADKADLNHMTAQKLAQRFQPTILSPMKATYIGKEMVEEAFNRQLSQDVMVFLIDNQDNFLIGMEGTSSKTEPEVAAPTDLPIENVKVPPQPLKKSSSF